MSGPLSTNVDCLGVPVPDLDEALSPCRDKLGHELLWRSETSAGLGFGDDGKLPELVLHTDPRSIAAAIKVESVSEPIERFVAAGGSVVEPSSDIPIGRLAVVSDPWNNHLVIFDSGQGEFKTDQDQNVTGVHIDA